jgi:hypothetical protein
VRVATIQTAWLRDPDNRKTQAPSEFLRGRSYNHALYNEDSRQLADLRAQDFSSVKAEIRQIFSEDPPPIVPVNLVDRVCKEIGELLVRPPRRTFTGLTAAQTRTIERMQIRTGWNLRMQEAAELLVCQNSVVGSVDPGRRMGRPSLRCWLPYQLRVHFDDPARVSESIQEADRVEIRTPVHVQSTAQTDTVYFSRRVYTPQEAWLEVPDKPDERIPLYGDSITHGLGYVPLAGVRRASAREGLWLPYLPYDILSVAIATCMGISDWHHIARYQIYSEEHWWGVEATKIAQDQATSPRFVGGWEVDKPDELNHEVVQRDPKLEKYIAIIEKTLELFAANRSVSRTALTESTGITGAAKAEERADQERERLRMEQLMQGFEREATQVLADVLRLDGREPVWAVPVQVDVDLEYNYVQIVGNRLQDLQADAILIQQDRTSPEELEASDSGVALDVAAERVMKRRLRRFAQQAQQQPSGPTPGLDRIAEQTAQE